MKLVTSLEIIIIGEHIERFLNMCSYHSIKLENIRKQNQYYYASMNPACFFSLKTIAKKSGVKVRIQAKNGIFFKIKYLIKNYVLLLFPLFCFILLCYSSHFLWNVKLSGNISITEDIMRDYLHSSGIYYGIPLKDIPIQELKSNLRLEFPQLTWVSAYLEGTTLKIDMKENDNISYTPNTRGIQKDHIASISGVIDSILVRKGTAMVKVGDEVNEGDVLIEGVVDIPAEDGTIKEQIPCKAEGDIIIISSYPIKESISRTYSQKEYTNRTYTAYELLLNHKSYVFPKKSSPFLYYDILMEEVEIPLLSIFPLPLDVNQMKFYEYYEVERIYTKEQCEIILKNKLEQICKTFIEKGVQIIEKNVKIETNSVYSTMSGSLTLKVPCNTKTILEDNS